MNKKKRKHDEIDSVIWLADVISKMDYDDNNNDSDDSFKHNELDILRNENELLRREKEICKVKLDELQRLLSGMELTPYHVPVCLRPSNLTLDEDVGYYLWPAAAKLKSLMFEQNNKNKNKNNRRQSHVQVITRSNQSFTSLITINLQSFMSGPTFESCCQGGPEASFRYMSQWCQKRIIADDPTYYHVALRGTREYGIEATRPIPRGQVLGLYGIGGELCTKAERDAVFVYTNEDIECSKYASSTYVLTKNVEKCIQQNWSIQLQDLIPSFTTTTTIKPDEQEHVTKKYKDDNNSNSNNNNDRHYEMKHEDLLTLVMLAHTIPKHCWLTHYINDWRPFPHEPIQSPRNQKCKFRENVMFIDFTYKGWPYIALVAVKDIPASTPDCISWLLTDYSDTHFKNLQEQESDRDRILLACDSLAVQTYKQLFLHS